MDETRDGAPEGARRATAAEAERLVVATITAHAESLLGTARRHSLCADDAQDAYQRGLEIFLRRAPRLDPERASRWLHTVVKHEAMAVRRLRQHVVASEELDLDAHEARHVPTPEEQALAFDDVARSAEALRQLKPQEVRALWLQMQGLSYREIERTTGWTYTKVSCQIGLRPGRAAVMLLANPLVRLHAASCVTQSPCKGGRSLRLPSSFPAAPYLRRGEVGCAPELAPK